MRPFALFAFAVLCVASLAGCHERWNQLGTGALGRYPTPADTFFVVRDADTWSFLWKWTTGESPAPNVNFSNGFTGDVVAAALLGPRNTSGYAAAFTNVTWQMESATAHVQETTPAPTDIVLQMITRPWTFARLTRPSGSVPGADGPLYFVKDGGAPILAEEATFEGLINQHFANVSTPQDTSVPSNHVPALESGVCPLHGDALVSAALNVNLSGQDVSNTAYYCAQSGRYWVRHVQGAFVGTITAWYGPFEPGS
ncbi:MAG: protease complex subunit PrcB family protein [Planctomycetes bacterium]|nr:protease complex subunit PrcB family protein [Planctomycetota bacterium]